MSEGQSRATAVFGKGFNHAQGTHTLPPQGFVTKSFVRFADRARSYQGILMDVVRNRKNAEEGSFRIKHLKVHDNNKSNRKISWFHEILK